MENELVAQIKKIKLIFGVSQAEIFKKAGSDPTNMHKWEGGVSMPSSRTSMKIRKAFQQIAREKGIPWQQVVKLLSEK